MPGAAEHKDSKPEMQLENRDGADIAVEEKDPQTTVDIISNASSSQNGPSTPEEQPNMEIKEKKMTKSKIAVLMTALCVS